MNAPDDLSSLLQGWQPEVADTHDFNRGVWMRLELAESRKGAGVAAVFAWVALFARPRIAVGAALLALFGGVFLGTLQARSSGEDQYLRSLNPYSLSSQDR
jgi:hypothetical protein